MFGNILDSIPVVGHVKAAWHYSTGDPWAGDKAMYEATRSAAVMAGGAVGVLGGPAGIIAGATGAGLLTDSVTSAITGNPKGVILGVSDIAEDISDGEFPLGAIARTGLTVGSDIVGGLGGATISKCATRVLGESAGKAIGKTVAKKVIETELSIVARSTLAQGTSRMIIVESERQAEVRSWASSSAGSHSNGGGTSSSTGQSSGTSEQTSTTSKKSETSTGSSAGGSGGQPPNNNNPNKKDHNEEKPESHWEAFLKIFKKKTLEEIIIKGKNIFKGLNDGQKRVLKKLIIDLRRTEYLNLAGIVDITVKLLSHLKDNDVTFQNFQSLIKFVVAYVHEMLSQRNDTYNQAPSDFPGISESYDEHQRQLTGMIISEIGNSIDALFNLFNDLANEIENLMIMPTLQFVNIFAAVYHYFKHKLIPGTDVILDPVQYFGLAEEMLNRLETLPQYQQLIRDGHQRIIYEKYYGDFGRRLIIVVKIQVGVWKLASCYFTDDVYEDDEDGDEWINERKL